MSTPPDPPDLIRSIAHRLAGDTPALPDEGPLPSFGGATGWLNSGPLTPRDSAGAWSSSSSGPTRASTGLANAAVRSRLVREVPGARSHRHRRAYTEFGFERNVDNVIARSRSFGVEYPIALAATMGCGAPSRIDFWPAVYVADAKGRIRYHHWGEGEYAMQEMVIQQLLVEAAWTWDRDLTPVERRGFEVRPTGRAYETSETYLQLWAKCGASRHPNEPWLESRPRLSPPTRLSLNQWARVRNLDHCRAVRSPERAERTIAFRFRGPRCQSRHGTRHDGDVAVVPRAHDGRPPPDAHGFDVDDQGQGTVAEQRLYRADPTAGQHRGASLRDRVPRRRRRGVLLHLRLDPFKSRHSALSAYPSASAGRDRSVQA